ncbi:MAG: biliverdin-producing heme oxygenase [Geminicoccaceae bacterium]|nr:biliverdin-producing heme oxygenase [Geminicoccaceae bacterium]
MVAPTGSPRAPRSGLADALREGTRELHRRAERTGVIAELLAGRVRPTAYLLFAFNLLPVYAALEAALLDQAHLPALGALFRPELARSRPLARDVAVLAERSPATPLRLLAESVTHRRRIETIARTLPERLLAHAYVRYLGDLSGGQVLRRLLARTPGIGPEAVRFYEFPDLDDLPRAKAAYRRAIDEAGAHLLDPAGVIEEAREAFQLTIALARAVDAASPEPQAGSRPPSRV